MASPNGVPTEEPSQTVPAARESSGLKGSDSGGIGPALHHRIKSCYCPRCKPAVKHFAVGSPGRRRLSWARVANRPMRDEHFPNPSPNDIPLILKLNPLPGLNHGTLHPARQLHSKKRRDSPSALPGKICGAGGLTFPPPNLHFSRLMHEVPFV